LRNTIETNSFGSMVETNSLRNTVETNSLSNTVETYSLRSTVETNSLRNTVETNSLRSTVETNKLVFCSGFNVPCQKLKQLSVALKEHSTIKHRIRFWVMARLFIFNLTFPIEWVCCCTLFILFLVILYRRFS
jgi:hypothetical protein